MVLLMDNTCNTPRYPHSCKADVLTPSNPLDARSGRLYDVVQINEQTHKISTIDKNAATNQTLGPHNDNATSTIQDFHSASESFEGFRRRKIPTFSYSLNNML